jgi:heme o synthase
MSTLVKPNLKDKSKAYFSLAKPGIVLGNVINYTTGFLLASDSNLYLFFIALIGLCLIIASACVFNNYIDKDSDEKMVRTKNRVLVRKLIPAKNALIFAFLLLILGIIFLAFTNMLTLSICLFGLFIYVCLYTFFKYYSYHATIVGSIAGAIPALVGYSAVKDCIDLKAIIFFTIIMIWQMPHFLAISIYRLEDFKRAGIPVLPLKKGVYRTKIQIISYIIAFTIVSSMLTILGYANYLFLTVVGGLSLYWILLSIKGLKCKDDNLWASQMFRFSLFVVLAIFVIISIQ